MTDYGILDDLIHSFKDCYWDLETSVFDLTIEPKKMISSVSKASMVTACFLFNEIINTSKIGFVKIIQTLISNMKDNCFLLVIDSAGSFSETTIGQEKSHMLYKFLDNLKDFRIIHGNDSIWFRFAKDLR